MRRLGPAITRCTYPPVWGILFLGGECRNGVLFRGAAAGCLRSSANTWSSWVFRCPVLCAAPDCLLRFWRPRFFSHFFVGGGMGTVFCHCKQVISFIVTALIHFVLFIGCLFSPFIYIYIYLGWSVGVIPPSTYSHGFPSRIFSPSSSLRSAWIGLPVRNAANSK